MPRNPTYFDGDLRETLLEATKDLVREAGVGSLTLRAAARRAGVSHAAPGYHFGNRGGLLAALAVKGHEVLRDRLGRAASRADDALSALAETAVAYVTFARQRPELFAPMVRRELWDDHADEVDPAFRADFAHWRAAVEVAQNEGWAAEANGDTVALAVWALAHGLASLEEAGALGDVPVDPVDVIELVIDGLDPTM